MLERYYLAYGSNLNLAQMRYRCFDAKMIGSIKIENYKLVYKGIADEFAYLTIEESEGSVVPMGLYELTPTDIKSLDNYEGYPSFYSKYSIPIKMGDKIVYALVYVMNRNFEYHKPSKEYVETCIKGYEDFGFDKSVLDKALTDTLSHMSKTRGLRK